MAHGSQQSMVTVTVKTLDGHCLTVNVPASGSVKDIRSQLQQQHGLAKKCGLYLKVRAAAGPAWRRCSIPGHSVSILGCICYQQQWQ
jgi:hypothetical protein